MRRKDGKHTREGNDEDILATKLLEKTVSCLLFCYFFVAFLSSVYKLALLGKYGKCKYLALLRQETLFFQSSNLCVFRSIELFLACSLNLMYYPNKRNVRIKIM